MRSKKGAQFERDFSRQLSMWWSSGKSDELFWRTPMSGGKATVNQSGTHAGDVRAVLPEGEGFTELFTLELKCGYPEADLQRVLDGTGSKHLLFDFIKQVRRDQNLTNSNHWMLVVKRDRKKPLVFLDMAAGERLHSKLMDSLDPMAVFICADLSFTVLPLEKLFKLDPKEVYEVLR